ncbi:MAG: sugar phosphate isomerase/epimerase [Clostridia bacterium]|nr:sugar phosphate isomerase/epimerase [Clostridia bacterium]
MRKLGMNICTAFGTNEIETMQLMKETGFDTCFTSWELGKNIKNIKRFADSIELEIETLHAPFSKINSMWIADSNEGDYYTEELKKCIWDAGENGIPYVVLHTTIGSVVPMTSHMGLTRFGKLVVEAEKCGVKLAFENLEFPRFMMLILNYFKNESVGFCYDIGHEYCYTPGLTFLPQLGDRLFCTHIHDNFGLGKEKNVDYRDDLHRIPFDCDLDFEKVCKKLKECGYTGSLMLEVGNRSDYNYYDGLTAKEFIMKAYDSAVKLRKLTDGE